MPPTWGRISALRKALVRPGNSVVTVWRSDSRVTTPTSTGPLGAAGAALSEHAPTSNAIPAMAAKASLRGERQGFVGMERGSSVAAGRWSGKRGVMGARSLGLRNILTQKARGHGSPGCHRVSRDVAGVDVPASAVAPMWAVAVAPDGRRSGARLYGRRGLRGLRVCNDRPPSHNLPQLLVRGLETRPRCPAYQGSVHSKVTRWA